MGFYVSIVVLFLTETLWDGFFAATLMNRLVQPFLFLLSSTQKLWLLIPIKDLNLYSKLLHAFSSNSLVKFACYIFILFSVITTTMSLSFLCLEVAKLIDSFTIVEY